MPARFAVVLLVALLVAACSSSVRQRRYSAPQSGTEKIAVIPFYPRPMLSRSAAESGLPPEEITQLVTRFVTEALAEQGFSMIPAQDVETAYSTGSGGVPIPRLEPALAAEFAARKFGATGVLLGEVLRYRERAGESMGSERSAAASFMVTLYGAPRATRLWSAQFEETQRSLSADPIRASRYPGGGTRWMTVAEFTRWGARQVAEQLRAAR